MIGKRIRQARRFRKMTQRDVREKAGLSAGFFSDLENDKRSCSALNLFRLAKALGRTMDWFLR